MSKVPAELPDEPLYRVESSIPPPGAEDPHSSETKIGDWALAIEEQQRASSGMKATAKVTAFDLAAALEKARPSLPPPAAPDVPPKLELVDLTEPPVAKISDENAGVQSEPRSSKAARSSLATASRRFVDVLIAVAVVAVSAAMMSR